MNHNRKYKFDPFWELLSWDMGRSDKRFFFFGKWIILRNNFPGNEAFREVTSVLPGNGKEPSIPFPEIISRIPRFQENLFPKWSVSRKAIFLKVPFPGKQFPEGIKLYFHLYPPSLKLEYFFSVMNFIFFKFWEDTFWEISFQETGYSGENDFLGFREMAFRGMSHSVKCFSGNWHRT